MTTGSVVALVILIASTGLLVLEAIAEAGLISLSRSRARLLASREAGNRRAERLQVITQNRERALGSFAVGRTLAVGTGFAAALYIIINELGFSWEAIVGTAVVGTLVAALIQAVPRRLAVTSPEGFGMLFVPAMDAFDTLFLVPAAILEAPAALVSRVRSAQTEHAPEPTELEVLLEHQESGGIEEDEREMIRGVIEIGERMVREVMVPRPDIAAVAVEMPMDEAAKVAVERGFSRLPVYEESIDNVIGVLYARDVLADLLAEGSASVRELMRDPVLVPESKLIDDLLRELRRARVHIAIVLDEYGGTAGIVTIEDMLEEIVGEIEDEFDHYNGPPVIRIAEDEALLDGRAPLSTLDELFGYRPEEGDHDTVGGYVFDLLGKIPEEGDEVRLNGLSIAVARMEGRRIARLKARRVDPQEADPSERDATPATS